MNNVAALVFDLDQTLFDRQSTFDRWLASLELLSCQQESLRLLDQNGYGDRGRFLAAYQTYAGEVLDHKAFVRGLTRFLQADNSLIHWLQRLRKAYQIAVLTNGGSWSQRTKLQALHLDSVFAPDRIFISADIGYAKPDRNAFEYVATVIGVPGNTCMYFGDRIDTDVVAARLAGWMGCHVRGPQDLVRNLNRLHEVAA